MGFSPPSHKPLPYNSQIPSLVLQKSRAPERPQPGVASNKLPSLWRRQSLTDTPIPRIKTLLRSLLSLLSKIKCKTLLRAKF